VSIRPSFHAPGGPARLGVAVDLVDCSACRGAAFAVADACWRHAQQQLAEAPSQTRASLSASLADRLETLSGELRELIRKSDWNNRHEQRGTEQNAWLRALYLLAGPPDAELDETAELDIQEPSRAQGISEPLRRAWRKVRPPKPVTLDIAGIKLEAALDRPGCLICTMATESLRRWLFMLLWEGVMDPDVRARIRAADGFCASHWWQLLEVERKELHSVSGVTILAEDLVASFAEQLRFSRTPDGPRISTCLACRSFRSGEDTALSGATRHFERPEFRAAYFASEGACPAHRRALSARIRHPDLASSIGRHEA
jgi:hypothetical protein